MVIRVLVLLALAAMTVGSCSSFTEPTSTIATPTLWSREVQLTESDNGRLIELHQSQGMIISLESNPSTGYTWEVEELDSQILRQVGASGFEPESDLMGAPGRQTLRFQALSPGQGWLRLTYRRAWEQGVPPGAAFSVQILVR